MSTTKKPTKKLPPTPRSLASAAFDVAIGRRKTFSHDRSKTVGASEIGRCARRVVYDKRGYAPDRDVPAATGFTVRGDVMEDAWTAQVVKQWVELNGGKLLYATQEQQVTFVGKGVPLSATPDGLAVGMFSNALVEYGIKSLGQDGVFVPEMKSIDPRFNAEKLPKPEHIHQCMAQMGMIRASTKYRPEWGGVVYVNASDWFDIKLIPVQYDEAQFRGLVKRADAIMKCADPNAMLPEGKMRGGKECSECPHAKKCLGYIPYLQDDDPKALPSTAVEKIRALAKDQKKWADAEEEARKRRLEAEANLYLGLADVKRSFVKGKGLTVLAKRTSSQNRYSIAKLVEALKAKGGNPEACREPTKEGTTLTVEVT